MSLQYGYIGTDEPEDPRALSRFFFPSKFGGKPGWLVPESYPADLDCSRCGKGMGFVMQIYAPRSQDPDHSSLDAVSRTDTKDHEDHDISRNKKDAESDNFHRALFLFTCPRCPDQFRCFRSQLAKHNPYYSADNPNDREVGEVLAEAFLEKKLNPGVAAPFPDAQLKLYPEREIDAEGGWTDSSDSEAGDDDSDSDSDSDAEKWDLLEDQEALLRFREHLAEVSGANLKTGEAVGGGGACGKREGGNDVKKKNVRVVHADGKGGVVSEKPSDTKKSSSAPSTQEGATPDREGSSSGCGGENAARASRSSAPGEKASDERPENSTPSTPTPVQEKVAEYLAKNSNVDPTSGATTTSSMDQEELTAFQQWQQQNSRAGKMDDEFRKFQKACKERPRCVLRFVNPADEDEEAASEAEEEQKKVEPLWFSGVDKIDEIPKCPRCLSKRAFEFQVMPQFIALQKTHHEFGTVLVWTCSSNCNTTSTNVRYLEEYVAVQREPADRER